MYGFDTLFKKKESLNLEMRASILVCVLLVSSCVMATPCATTADCKTGMPADICPDGTTCRAAKTPGDWCMRECTDAEPCRQILRCGEDDCSDVVPTERIHVNCTSDVCEAVGVYGTCWGLSVMLNGRCPETYGTVDVPAV